MVGVNPARFSGLAQSVWHVAGGCARRQCRQAGTQWPCQTELRNCTFLEMCASASGATSGMASCGEGQVAGLQSAKAMHAK